MCSSYAKAVQPLIAKLYLSKAEGEFIENLEELKALLTSILESEEIEFYRSRGIVASLL